MSQIDELIAEYCPEGVEFKPFSETGTFTRGGGPQKKDFVSAGTGCIHYGQIYTFYGISAEETNVYVDEVVASKSRQAKPQDVVIAVTGENDEDLGRAVAWIGEESVAVSNHTLIFSTELNAKYVSYFLRSTGFHRQKKRFITGTKVRALPESAFSKILIPVPPLEVQRAVVDILDKFTALEAELEAELEARKKQYEHYRYELLSFEKDISDISFVKLSDVVEYVNGKAHEKLAAPEGEVAMVTARFVSRNGEANRFLHQHDVLTPANIGDVALVLSDLPNGRALARTFYVDRDNAYAINQRIARLRVKDNNLINPKFVHYFLDRNPGLLRYDNGFDQTHLSKSQVTGLPFPIISREQQDHIVQILDKFDAVVNDLSSGLPAEIAARRKQYEYYRDQLLAFKELTA